MPQRPGSLLVCVALLVQAGIAGAYEDDVHYGLTRWLALEAGFSPEHAEIVARADVGVDHSALSAIRMVIHSACFGRNETGSRTVKRIHFPGEGPVPGPPEQRVVKAGSDAARREYLRVIAVPSGSEPDNLAAFGEALHPLQDSWSHQGEPDPPFGWPCHAHYSWGHPAARGGWRSHEADLTHRHVDDAVEMAQATYAALCRYREKLAGQPCKRSFVEISGDVLALSQARTKAHQVDWFVKRGFDDPRFVYATNVPNGGLKARNEPADYAGAAALAAVRRSNAGALPDTPEASFMGEFLREWTTGSDLPGLAREAVAVNAYRGNLGLGERGPVDPVRVEAQLAFWRFRDHGLLQEALEGRHELVTKDGGELPVDPDALAKEAVPYESMDEALLPFDESGVPIVTFVTERSDGTELWIGVVRFRHAPDDAVFVVAEIVDGKPRVVSIDSIVTR